MKDIIEEKIDEFQSKECIEEDGKLYVEIDAHWLHTTLTSIAKTAEERGEAKERERIYRHIVSEEGRNAPYDTDWKQGYLSGIDDVATYVKSLSPTESNNT